MADEEVKPVEPTVNEPVEPAQEELPLAAEAAPEAETKAEETPSEPVAEEPKEEPKPVDWKDRELKSKHRQLQDAKRVLAEKEARIAALEALGTAGSEPAKPIAADDVEKRAQELVAQRQYVEDCNKTAQDGETRFKTDWKPAVDNLEMLGGFDMPTMNGVMATDDPAKVLYELGKDPDKYHRIMGLTLEKRIIEMGKLAMQPASPRKVSEAPAPVAPVGGRAAAPPATLNDKMDDDQYFAIRRAQRRAKWEANNVRR